MEIFKCSRCQKNSKRTPLNKKGSNSSWMYRDVRGVVFYGDVCLACRESRRKKYWASNKHIWSSYEKTKKGFLMRAYRNMLSRVRGVTKNKNHLYLGLPICKKEDFYSWSLSESKFNSLFDAWESCGYPRKITPSIDRIDPKRGYEFGNMRWVTFSENCSKTSANLPLDL